MAKTVVGLFNSTSEAEQAKQELISDGYAAGELTVISSESSYSGTSTSSTETTETHRSVGQKIEHFFSNLMGGDEDAHEHYASGVNQGGALLAVRTEDADADEIADWLDEHGARKIDRNARSVDTGTTGYRDNLSSTGSSSGSQYNTGSSYGDNLANTTGTAAATGTAAGESNAEILAARGGAGAGTAAGEGYNDRTSVSDSSRQTGYNQNDTDLDRERVSRDDRNTGESQTIPVVEEEIEVGKRTVDRGGVRVYTHVTEQPVDESVTLRDERINVERRAVDRPATAADFSANQGKVIEMYAQGEEAVVGKKTRVVEEVVVGKEVNERTENVHDTVRKTEVDVEQVGDKDTDRNREAASYTGAKTTDRK